MTRRSKSSGRWLDEHFSDKFVIRAQREGWRSRAVFKLEELDQKRRLFKPGQVIVDLGAAPGGWSQYAVRALHGKGHVIAIDLLPMEPLENVTVLQADFSSDACLAELHEVLGDRPVDLVMSDMAPNISGMRSVDQPRAMYLAELAMEFTRGALIPRGTFVCKLFQGEGFDEFVRLSRTEFESVTVRKPKASRPRSREVYMLARGFGGNKT